MCVSAEGWVVFIPGSLQAMRAHRLCEYVSRGLGGVSFRKPASHEGPQVCVCVSAEGWVVFVSGSLQAMRAHRCVCVSRGWCGTPASLCVS